MVGKVMFSKYYKLFGNDMAHEISLCVLAYFDQKKYTLRPKLTVLSLYVTI